MGALLQGRIEPGEYNVLLRNLHALYEALEEALDRHAALPHIAPLRIAALYRAPALAADLARLHGAHWRSLPLAAAMSDYIARIAVLAGADPAPLAAHAYVRYLGDLSGGQILRDLVRRALALGGNAGTAFYAFGSDDEVTLLKAAFRSAMDGLPVNDATAAAIINEARAAFALHIRFFNELQHIGAARL